MKKALILTLVMLMVMVMSLSAFATSTRTLTLGENNNVLLDDNNIWMYPSRLFQYPNIATGDFAREAYGSTLYNQFYNFGVNWKFGEKKPWVLGTYFSTGGIQDPSLYQFDNPNGMSVPGFNYYTDNAIGSPAPTPVNGVTTDRRMDLLYSRKFGTTLFGFEFNFVHSSNKSEATANNISNAYGDYGFTLGLTPEDGKWDVAVNFALGSFHVQDSAGKEFVSSDGYSDINFYGRYFWKYNEMITFVPHASVGFGTHGVKYDTLILRDLGQKTSRTFFEVGAGMNYRPVNGVLGVLDFGVQYDKVKNEMPALGLTKDTSLEFSEFYFPYWKIGVEGEVFNWMTLRLGARSNWVNYKQIEPGNGLFNKYSSKYAENNTYLGLGLNFNRLHIDTYTDPQIILHGFDFITGNNGSDSGPSDLNFHVSVLYDMF